ncbi:MAG: periplasmic heavy metal sensor [Bacteroidota bacterium]
MGYKSKAILLIFFTLLTGIGIGLWAGGRIFDSRVERIRVMGSRDGLQNFLNQELDLSLKQAEQVKAVLEEHFPRMRQIHRDFFQERRQAAEDLNAEIMPLLNAEQQKKWQEHQKRVMSRSRKRGGGERHGPPRPHQP